MTLVLGCGLGAGILLIASSILWPAPAGRRGTRSGSPGIVRSRLIQAGLGGVPSAAIGAVSLLVGLALGATVEALLGVQALSLVAGLAGLLLPALLVSWRADARRRAQATVWPDVVDHLVSAVRAGLALPDGVAGLASRGPEACRAAFGEFERQYRATGDFAHSLAVIKDLLADPIADRILETLRMAREVGGSDLTLVLRNLAAWIRQDTAVRQEAEARRSWIVHAAKLGVAAPWIVLLLLGSRPEAAHAYNSPAGLLIILGGLLLSTLAYRLMIGLGRLPEERRWFA